jgi:hypothetical protein
MRSSRLCGGHGGAIVLLHTSHDHAARHAPCGERRCSDGAVAAACPGGPDGGAGRGAAPSARRACRLRSADRCDQHPVRRGRRSGPEDPVGRGRQSDHCHLAHLLVDGCHPAAGQQPVLPTAVAHLHPRSICAPHSCAVSRNLHLRAHGAADSARRRRQRTGVRATDLDHGRVRARDRERPGPGAVLGAPGAGDPRRDHSSQRAP